MEIEASTPEEDTILDQTSKFRSLTENLKLQFLELLTLRKEKSDRESPAFTHLYSSIIYNLSSLRTNHRILYQVNKFFNSPIFKRVGP